MDTQVLTKALAGPPDFVALIAHPLRWSLLRELARSDRAVWELTERVGEPQNLVSYHLRRLREGGVVSARRSAADGRDNYYTVDFEECERQLQATGGALHPGLAFVPATPNVPAPQSLGRRVLFLCTGNSARSQIAETLLKHMSGGTVDAASAGSHPKQLHPNAIAVMRKRGFDISGNRTKHLDEFVAERFAVVITLCDRVREVCPQFPSHPELVHWSIPDPAEAGSTGRAEYAPFEHTAAALETRIRFLLPLLTESSTTTTAKKSRRRSDGNR